MYEFLLWYNNEILGDTLITLPQQVIYTELEVCGGDPKVWGGQNFQIKFENLKNKLKCN